MAMVCTWPNLSHDFSSAAAWRFVDWRGFSVHGLRADSMTCVLVQLIPLTLLLLPTFLPLPMLRRSPDVAANVHIRAPHESPVSDNVATAHRADLARQIVAGAHRLVVAHRRGLRCAPAQPRPL